jgi:hypothetical protein
MDDPLDNDLKNRIREVFDNYDDEHADEGWQLLREKYPEKARRSPVLWLWWGSAAAVLLLFLGIFWLGKKPQKENKLVGNKIGIHHPIVKSIEPQKNSNIIINKSNNTGDVSADSVINSHQTQKLAENQVLRHSHKNNVAKTTKPSAPIEASNIIANQRSKTNKKAISNNEAMANNIEPGIAAINPPKTKEKQAVDITQPDKTQKIDSSANVTARALAITKPNNGANIPDQSKQPNKAVFANNEVSKDKKEPGHKGRTVSFGIYAATYVNYASKSNNQVNEGIGISSDIRISRKFNLSTGIAIGQNSLNYDGQLPPEQSRLLSATANSSPNNSISDKTSALAAPAYRANSFFAATPSLKNYSASLVGLEIPINLKYHFNPEKNETFVSIGISSGTFINERYTSTYSYTTPFASNLSQTTNQSLQQKFNGFYFAKTLNFSFGAGYHISGNDLIIEPFLKYPIDGLGSQQIKFGSGGVNLKFNFQGKRRHD